MKIFIQIIFLGIVFIFPKPAQGQLLSVSGQVKNFISGQVVANATVYESVSGIGTITNSEGYYRLLLNRGQQNLRISSNGYEIYNSSFTLVADTIISVELKPQNLTDTKIVAGNKIKKDSTENAEKEEPSRRKR